MKRLPAHISIKILSVLILSLMMFLRMPVSVSFLEADFCLLFLPSAADDGRPSICFVCSFLAAVLSMTLLGLVKWIVPASSAILLSYLVFRFICRHRGDMSFMGDELLWKIAQYYARLMYACGLLTISVICGMSFFVHGLDTFSSILSSLAFVILFALSFQPGMLPLDAKKEAELRNFHHPAKDDVEKDLMESLYQRVVEIMEKEQPYLEHSYGLPELTADAYTNRSYLSKTVNTMSGKSVPQFINSYRVKHAAMLIAMEPDLKMSEVSSLSGFNNVASFNVWFKSEMKQTPSGYLDSVRFSSQTLPSSSSARERSPLQGSF